MEIHRPVSGWRPSSPEIVAGDFDLFAASHPAVAIHFWARWNGVDPPMDRNVQAIAEEFAGRVCFVSCDVDRPENRQFCKRSHVVNVPTIAVYRGKELHGTVVGLEQPQQLFFQIENFLTTEPRCAQSLWRRLVPF